MSGDSFSIARGSRARSVPSCLHRIITMEIADIVVMEMMPSVPVARLCLFPATEKQQHTNEVNSFGLAAVFLQHDSSVSGPRSPGFGLRVGFILIT